MFKKGKQLSLGCHCQQVTTNDTIDNKYAKMSKIQKLRYKPTHQPGIERQKTWPLGATSSMQQNT